MQLNTVNNCFPASEPEVVRYSTIGGFADACAALGRPALRLA